MSRPCSWCGRGLVREQQQFCSRSCAARFQTIRMDDDHWARMAEIGSRASATTRRQKALQRADAMAPRDAYQAGWRAGYMALYQQRTRRRRALQRAA